MAEMRKRRERGPDPEVASYYDFSKGRVGAVLTHPGKTRITIWIDNAVIKWFRNYSERQGVGYQTLINDALRDFAKADHRPISAIIREAIRDELRHLTRIDGTRARK